MRHCEIPDVPIALIDKEIRAESWCVWDEQLAGKDKQ